MNGLDDKTVEKYLTGACSEAEMEQLLQWLKASEENRQAWLKLRMVAVRSSFVHFSDPKQVERAFSTIWKERFARTLFEKQLARKYTMRFMRYAAAILLLIGISYATYHYVIHGVAVPVMVVVAGANEEPKQVMLHDSSRVWLSAGSRIEYPERFGKRDRTVAVEGKVYFEVARDTLRPFYVNTDVYTVKVLGTSFEVNAPKYNPSSDVTLVEGKVEILDTKSLSLCTLHPGQQFEIDKRNNRFMLNRVDAEMYASWHGGQLDFDGLTFAEIAKALERHYGVRIILDEGVAQKQKLVGSLNLQKDIVQMMQAIAMVVPIKYQVQTATVVQIQSR